MKTSPILKVVYAIIAIVVISALGASFTHMKDWTLHVLPNETPDAFGWVNAIISELTPLAGSLYLMHVHKHGGPKWPAWVMLIYGFSASAIGQVHAAGDDPTMWALIAALLPVTAAFVLIKVLFILLERTETAPSVLDQPVQVSRHQNPGQPVQEMVHHPVQGPVQVRAASALDHPGPASPEAVDQPGPDHPVRDETAGQTPVHEVDQESTVQVDQDGPAKPVQPRSKTPVRKPVQPRSKPVQKPVVQPKTDPVQMAQAVEAVRSNRLSLTAAAKEFGVPKTSLGRAVQKADETPAAVDQVADAELENVDWESGLAEILGRKNDDET